jgi:hypothetical protein
MATTAPDLTLFNELYEEIEKNPPAIEARKLLVRQCYEAGWMDAAQDALKELRVFDPSALKEESWAKNLLKTINKSKPKKPEKLPYKAPSTPEELEAQKQELIQGYEKLQLQAKKMLHETRLLSNLANSSPNTETKSRFSSHEPDLNALINGRVHSILKKRQPGPIRITARQMELSSSQALSLATSDLENVARWLRSHSNTTANNDPIREAVVKRSQALTSALPDALKNIPRIAMMHIEHEILGRTYHSSETMYGDLIADIPRDKFLVTDDGYAWDISELVQAIQSNNGVMRNPLSKNMFTVDDVRAIIAHPLGKDLVVLQVEQGKLLKGVRERTVDELESLAKTLEGDMSEDQRESREVLERFLVYLVRLPEEEQRAVDGLRVPAVDSHTGGRLSSSPSLSFLLFLFVRKR